MFWVFIGIVATVLSSTQLIPQTIKAFKTRSVKDISLLTFIIIMFASFAWFLHGLHVDDIFIVITNAIAFASSILIIVAKLIFR